MILNMTGGAGGSKKSQIIVTVDTGSTVYITNQDGQRKDATEQNGTWTFKGVDIGIWTITATLGDQASTQVLEITEATQQFVYRVTIGYRIYASDFDWSNYGTLGTDYQIVTDDDVEIPESEWATTVNWKARLLTSGTVMPTKDGEIDVFLVGGGGGGSQLHEGQHENAPGGGGYTITQNGVSLTRGTSYPVNIGAGGAGAADNASSGGDTTAFDFTANGGKGAKQATAGAGGTETGEFGGTSTKTYSGHANTGSSGADNTGKGAGGGYKYENFAGGSGIVIIRNARAA